MSDCLLWIGTSAPPDAVSRLADRRGWSLRAAAPSAGAAVATRERPDAIIVDGDAPDIDQLRAAAPATPIAYCPRETTPDGIAAATGADLVFPQDATAWGADALAERLSAATAPVADVITGEATIEGPGVDGTDLAALRRKHERLWTLFRNLPDPVVDAEHVEGGPVIRAANDAFTAVFDCDREAVVGEPIDDVLASPAGEPDGSMPPEAINEQVREGEVTGAKVRRETTHGARTFLFRGIPYAEDGTVRAFGIYTDVTEVERRERHVKVLDRLLRHNLRNDLGIVIGRAENILERSDDPVVREDAAGLVEAADGLIDLSDTAKRIRRIIENPTTERCTVDVGELFERVSADVRERLPGATIRVGTDVDGFAVLANSDLRLALEELVENGVVHGGDHPTVELRAERFGPAPEERVDLLVVDDGPGIPEAERAAVTGSREITQLQHGSGLGLWLVRWAVESIGGDVGFERRDGHTVVRLRLRRADSK